MKRRANEKAQLRSGELYLFHSSNPDCPSSSSLWGVYDKTSNGRIYLEHCTTNHRQFQLRYKLPLQYRFHQMSTGSALRDYMYNLGVWEFFLSIKKFEL